MKYLAYILIPLFSGCAHHVTAMPRSNYEWQAKTNVEAMPWIYMQPENLELLAACRKGYKSGRNSCYETATKTIQARINLAYSSASQKDVENYFWAHRAELMLVSEKQLKDAVPELRKPKWKDHLAILKNLDTYELIARGSQLEGEASSRYAAQIRSVDRHNAYVDEANDKLRNSLNNLIVESRLTNLEHKISPGGTENVPLLH